MYAGTPVLRPRLRPSRWNSTERFQIRGGRIPGPPQTRWWRKRDSQSGRLLMPLNLLTIEQIQHVPDVSQSQMLQYLQANGRQLAGVPASTAATSYLERDRLQSGTRKRATRAFPLKHRRSGSEILRECIPVHVYRFVRAPVKAGIAIFA